jgi:hypothetical protein
MIDGISMARYKFSFTPDRNLRVGAKIELIYSQGDSVAYPCTTNLNSKLDCVSAIDTTDTTNFKWTATVRV